MNSHEERLLEELLREAYHPTEVDALITQALARCEEGAGREGVEMVPVSLPARGRRGWVSAVTTMVALVIVLLTIWPSTTTATEILHEVVASAEAPVDREYQLELSGRVKLSGVLWVWGGDQFVLRLPAVIQAHDQYIWLGSNGSDFWIVPALGPVIVTRQADWLLRQLRDRHQMSLPILHLSTVTRRLETRYTTPRLVNDAPGLKHLATEQKLSDSIMLPDRVDLYARDKVIALLHLHWNARHGGDEPLDMKLTLNPSKPPAAGWYEHSAHHAAGRIVLPAEEKP